MFPALRYALLLLVVGIISLAAFRIVVYDSPPKENPSAPPRAQRSSVDGNAEKVASDAGKPINPARLRDSVATPFLKPRDWSNAVVLKERKIDDGSGKNISASIRDRIVRDRGFSNPVHIRESVEKAFAGGSDLPTALVSARIANQILLTATDAIEDSEVVDIAESIGWRILPHESSPYIAVLETDEVDFSTVDSAIEAIRASGTTLNASSNQIYYALATPNDPRFTSNGQWGLSQVSDIDIDAPEGWELRNSAASIVVAIVDTGIRITHEDLRSNIWKNPRDTTRNGRDDDGNGYVDDVNGIDSVNSDTLPNDDNGHGTHVAGIVGAAGNNGKGVAGVAWDVQLMPIKSLNADGRGTTSSVIKGMDYAIKNGARIINASWGADSFDDAIEAAIERARAKGILIVAAAGNDGYPYPIYPASSWSDNVVSVGSINKSGNLSSFSNYSDIEVDVLAPGSDIVSTWHDADDAYTNQDGTSMAAPFVSGILALNLAQFSNDDYQNQIRRLIASSKPRSSLRSYAQSGGIVNLALSLKMSHIPVPPRILSSWISEPSVNEGSVVTFHVEAESELELSYKWYHNEKLLSETSNLLTLENAQPYQRGQYVVEVINADATVSASFELEVYPRMWEIEALLNADLRVFASHENHWEIVEEEGASAIVNRELAKGVSARLHFVSAQPGMLQLFGKKPTAATDATTTSLHGANTWGYFSEPTWSRWEARRDWGSGFDIALVHDSGYHNQVTPARSLFLRAPKFFAVGELPPEIWYHPQSQRVRIGEIVALSVFAYGETLQYQWYKNGSRLEGETEDSLRFIVESAEDGGNYYVTVGNEKATSTSSHALIEVDTSPQPAAVISYDEPLLAIESGNTLTLSMRVFGTEPITYQWYKDDIAIPGATASRLSLGPASVAHEGVYSLTVKNHLNDYPASSSGLWVHVSEHRFPPRFSIADKEEKHLRIAEGQNISLQRGYPAGSDPIAFQWFKDGEPVDASGSYISFYPVATADAGTYYLEASNSVGVEQSGRMTLEVTPPLSEAIDYDTLLLEAPWHGPLSIVPSYQTADTWDGKDALELNSDGQLGLSSMTLRNTDERRVIAFHWKIEAGTDGVLELSGHVYSRLSEQGTWNQATFLLEPYADVTFTLQIGEGEGRAWLDAFQEIKSPYLLKGVTYSPPKLGQKLTLWANMGGEGLAYQWYKDDVAIVGATSPTLTIEQFAAQNTGSYRLDGSNAHGNLSTPIVKIGLEALDGVISPRLEPAFSDASKAFLDQDQDGPFLGFKLGEDEVWTLKTQATGPATLAISHALGGARSTLRIDGKGHELDDRYERSQTDYFLDAGEHAVTLTINPHYEDFPGKLYSMTLRDSPLARVSGNQDWELGDYGTPIAEFAGIEPLTVTWFRDGSAISTLHDVKSGQTILFDRPLDGHDHGAYHISVADAQGKTSRSEPYFFETSYLLGQVMDYPDWLSIGHDRIQVDRESKLKGEASLLLQGPFYKTDPRVSLYLYSNYATLGIRSAGFPPDSLIRYFYDGAYRTIPANADWKMVTVEHFDDSLSLLLPDSSENGKIWLDNLSPLNRAQFLSHPTNVATYLGASVRLDALAYEPSVGYLNPRWTKDGQPIASESSEVLIESVSSDDLATYQASVVSPNGQVVKSRPATLSLLSTDLAEAIGYPGARITTTGSSPWRVDYAASVEGASSIVSGVLEPREIATIEIEIDGPASWGLYSYQFDALNLNNGRWQFQSAPFAPAGDSSSLLLSVQAPNHYAGADQAPGIRVDGVRLTRLSDHRFEPWIEKKLAALATPLAAKPNHRTSDPDNDGLPNWLEFALDLDPATRSSLPAMRFVQSETGSPFAYLQFYAARSNEYSISYEASFDLQNWFSVKPATTVVKPLSEYDHIKAAFTLAEPNRRPYFVRWSIHWRTEEETGAF